MVKNVHPISFKVTREQRSKMLGQRPHLLWFTGLSGAGKSTLANATEVALAEKGFHTYLLDGDNVRVGLCKDLTFSEEDRKENIRRISEVGALMLDAGLIVLSSFISPFLMDRELVKTQVGSESFLEIHVDCPLDICEKRDVKGLYGKARKGLIKDFTGITSPYEPPTDPFLKINTHEETVEEAVNRICTALEDKIKL